MAWEGVAHDHQPVVLHHLPYHPVVERRQVLCLVHEGDGVGAKRRLPVDGGAENLVVEVHLAVQGLVPGLTAGVHHHPLLAGGEDDVHGLKKGVLGPDGIDVLDVGGKEAGNLPIATTFSMSATTSLSQPLRSSRGMALICALMRRELLY